MLKVEENLWTNKIAKLKMFFLEKLNLDLVE